MYEAAQRWLELAQKDNVDCNEKQDLIESYVQQSEKDSIFNKLFKKIFSWK